MARKWPRECTSGGVITIGAHRLRRRCRSMIAMDGSERKIDTMQVSKERKGKEEEENKREERKREKASIGEKPWRIEEE